MICGAMAGGDEDIGDVAIVQVSTDVLARHNRGVESEIARHVVNA